MKAAAARHNGEIGAMANERAVRIEGRCGSRRSQRLSVAIAATLAAQAALAQDVQVETITVTGSRIPRADLTSNSPVSVVGTEELRQSASLEVEQVLETLPQVVGTFGASSNNPGTGTATVDLRAPSCWSTVAAWSAQAPTAWST
jgi:hypothetical protein